MLMMTLSEVKSISVRGNINRDTTRMSLYDINYDRAVTPRLSPNGSPVPTVEQCLCPEGYTGKKKKTLTPMGARTPNPEIRPYFLETNELNSKFEIAFLISPNRKVS